MSKTRLPREKGGWKKKKSPRKSGGKKVKEGKQNKPQHHGTKGRDESRNELEKEGLAATQAVVKTTGGIKNRCLKGQGHQGVLKQSNGRGLSV